MIREIAGVLDRTGPPRLAAPMAGARTATSGALALAWTGDAGAEEGGGRALVDGALDVAPADEPALLAAWRAAGDAVLPGLRGEFALLLWDGAAGILASDHLSTRCWYWHDDGSRLRFATEIHLLLGLLPQQPGPDETALVHWLNISGVAGDHTLYAGIHRLNGACSLRLDPRRPAQPRRYWELRPTEPALAARGEHARRWRDALQTAVARRVRGPSDTAVLLSGGLDSGSVAAALPAEGRPERAYSAVFPDHPTIDESALIAELAGELRLELTRAVVRRGSVLEGALPHIERWALPPVSPNMFFWNPLMRRIAGDGTVVLLDGEGGDEIFGLAPVLVSDRLARGDVLGALALVYQAPGALGRPSRHSVWRYFKQAGLMPLAPWWLHAASRRLRDPERYVLDWIDPRLARLYVDSVDGAAYKRLPGPRWWAWKVDLMLRGLGPPLAYDHIRHRTAAVGVFSRHPVLDVDLIETVFDTPPELSFDPYVSRPLLREAMAGLLPETVRTRVDKSRFDAIFHEALAGPDLVLARGLLGPDARAGAYVDLGRVRSQLLDAPPESEQARMGWAIGLWRLLTAECWLRYVEDPGALRSATEAIGVPEPAVSIEP
jgi:asparagine synthase (glutamine-hydrolysing)